MADRFDDEGGKRAASDYDNFKAGCVNLAQVLAAAAAATLYGFDPEYDGLPKRDRCANSSLRKHPTYILANFTTTSFLWC
jgi:hypothetical protein